jgi:hypothetical protein
VTMRLCAAALVLFFAGSIGAAAQPAKKGCDLPNADTAVYGITLGDPTSTRRVLTEDYKTISDNPGSDVAWMIFASRDNKQLLMLRHHAGDLQHSFLEFEVKFGRHDKKPLKLPVYEFVTGKGIKLGMKRKAVLAKFGPCFNSTTNDGVEIVRYEIKDEKAGSGVLKATNMPQYYAEYEFRGGVLMRFKFGYQPV